MGYAHLHVHTEYSILRSSVRIEGLVKKAAELGMKSLAITDYGVMYGVIAFYKACKKYDIKPIIGCEIYVDDDNLILLAKDEEGYTNLKKMVSLSFVRGFRNGKPRISKDVLAQHSGGLIAISSDYNGEVCRKLMMNDRDGALKCALEYSKMFGKDNYYLEIFDHNRPEDKALIRQIMKLSGETGIPMVALNEIHYLNREDATAYNVLECIQTHKKIGDIPRTPDRLEHFVKSEEQMRQAFPYALEAVENTCAIADRCHVEIEFNKPKLPKYPIDNGMSSREYLEKLCAEGIKKRYKKVTKEVSERLEYELSVIDKMGFVDYFLVVWDFVNYARKKGIVVGDGRGSAAGSIVSYALGITNIDPIRYNLIFERFLNPERVSMPDIDIDFAHNRRDEVVRYVIDKYGAANVVQIVAFGTLASRAVIRDVVRVMDIGYEVGDEISHMLSDSYDLSLADSLKTNDELRGLYETDVTIRNLINISMELEGLIRHTTIHPAGVVICDEDAADIYPLALSNDGNVVIQCEKKEVEELGLLKIDFLSLRNLTIIDDTLKALEEEGIHVDLSTIDYHEKGVYAMISAGDTDGVFQLESRGMKMFMKNLKPSDFDQIVAGIALFRPGPMDFIPKYIEARNSGKVSYEHPMLEPILKDTYGCIVYQEQVMQIFRDFAGYSMGRSDMVRRIMAAKKTKELESERQNFVYGNATLGIKGCVVNGIDAKLANHIFDEMLDFASYAFNKSHAVAYSVISYKTAYLKYHYPVQFMSALLTSVMSSTTKVSEYISAFRRRGGKVLPPSVNEPARRFLPSGDNVRYALTAIKNVGDSVVDAIIAEYRQRPYKDFYDFLDRNISHGLNKKCVECLIKAGALDGLGVNRKQMIHNYERVMEDIQRRKKTEITGQISLFDFENGGESVSRQAAFAKVEEFSSDELLAMESEVLGIYVSAHPLDEFLPLIEKNVTHYSSDFYNDDGQNPISEKDKVIIGGFISKALHKVTRKGDDMAIITLEDYYGQIEVLVFQKTYKKVSQYIAENKKIFVVGNLKRDDTRSSIIAMDIIPFDSMPRIISIGFDDMQAFEKLYPEVEKHIYTQGGHDSVVAYLVKERAKKPLAKRVIISDEDMESLKKILGDERVVSAQTNCG